MKSSLVIAIALGIIVTQSHEGKFGVIDEHFETSCTREQVFCFCISPLKWLTPLDGILDYVSRYTFVKLILIISLT